MMRRRLILLVEDNPDDIELTLLAFRKSGVPHAIDVVRDGRQALDYLLPDAPADGHPKPLPDVVLLDLKLPRIDGLDVLRQLRADKRTRRVPVVVLTSSREERDVLRSYDLGANSFVGKPVDFDEFLTAARQLGVYWLDLNLNATLGR